MKSRRSTSADDAPRYLAGHSPRDGLLPGVCRGILWHVCSPLEADDVRWVIGPRVEVLVAPDDVRLPLAAARVPSPHPGALRIVWVGRFVPHKGLDLLLAAVKAAGGPVEVGLHGPPEDPEHLASLHRQALSLPPTVRVRFHGPVAPEAVPSVHRSADVFAAATRGQSFGHVIAEALSVGVLVLAADVTPWGDVLRDGGGMVLPDRDTGTWAAALHGLAVMDPGSRHAARLRAAGAYGRWRSQQDAPHVLTRIAAWARVRRDRPGPLLGAQ